MISNKHFSLLPVAVLLAGCGAQGPVDWDLRNGLNTREAALNATTTRPQADTRGIISYPGYQVAIAQPGDTVAAIAQRIGTDPSALARHNALEANAILRGGEVIALPTRIATATPAGMAPTAGGITTGAISVTELASGAIDRSQSTATPAPAAPAGQQPAQHRVTRGETAYSIARNYNISPKALAEWNGLDANLSLREGQVLMIPVAGAVAAPGAGSAAPQPPAAAQPIAQQPAVTAPASPAMAEQRTSSARFAMPASGSIIRGYQKGRNEGIDIGASAGSPVLAAADGTVAAITRDTDQQSILVLRHPDNTLTVYAGIDALKVAKGASVTRGQQVAAVRASGSPFLHFEVRKGFESVDPMPYLQ